MDQHLSEQCLARHLISVSILLSLQAYVVDDGSQDERDALLRDLEGVDAVIVRTEGVSMIRMPAPELSKPVLQKSPVGSKSIVLIQITEIRKR